MCNQAKLALAAVLCALAFSPASRAQAAPMLDFGIIAPTPGSVSYDGSGGPLVGANIEVDMVVGLGTPLNNHVARVCDRCTLSFTTGAFATSTSTSWSFGPGGSITLTGGMDLSGNGNAGDVGDIPLGTTLLSGTFIESPVVLAVGGGFKVAGAVFVDRKDTRLLDLYGLRPDVLYSGGFNFSFMAPGVPPSGFSGGVVLSGDIVNQPVGIPSSILLFGSGLIGLFVSRRETAKKASLFLTSFDRRYRFISIYLILRPYSAACRGNGEPERKNAVRAYLHVAGLEGLRRLATYSKKIR
jgi:hypothetical protein